MRPCLLSTQCCTVACRGDIQPGWHKHTPGGPRRGLPSALAKAALTVPVVAPASPHRAKKKAGKKQTEVEMSAPSQVTMAHAAHSMTGMPMTINCRRAICQNAQIRSCHSPGHAGTAV